MNLRFMIKHFYVKRKFFTINQKFYQLKLPINFMFLLEDATDPDHATFAGFRSLHFAPCAEKILAEMSDFLYDIGKISGKAIFIDGTKIEAYANKYTFV